MPIEEIVGVDGEITGVIVRATVASADSKMSSPACVTFIEQSPLLTAVTRPPEETVQKAVVVEVNVTGNPEDALADI